MQTMSQAKRIQMKRLFSQLVILLLITCVVLSSCKKEKVPNEVDIDLYNMSISETGFTWFKFSNAYLDKSSGSAHDYPFLRTRYDSTAATVLDVDGKIQAGASFPEGSLIVKELINDDFSIGRYAILYKASSSDFADANGWVWGYINSDKTIAAPASDKGASCISCHQQSGSIDYMLMNKYFP